MKGASKSYGAGYTFQHSHPICLTYISVPHLGYGFVQTCISILENFPSDLLSARIVLPKTFRTISPSVNVIQAIPPPVPYQFASPIVKPALSYFFKRALAAADPAQTVVYFWPNPPLSLVRYARARGFITVREMINTAMDMAKRILDEAYDRLALPAGHEITAARVEEEHEELAEYDYIFASNPMVERSLTDIGIDPKKILRSSFGWTPSTFASSATEQTRDGFRAVFVGRLCVRKGLPQLLSAWEKSGVSGELILVGHIEPSLQPLLDQYLKRHNIRLTGFVSNVGQLYKSADVFIFPTLEEGGPQVTYEAAGCGLPVITTFMGAGRLVKDGINGLIVKPYDVDDLASAISCLASSPELRKRLGQQAEKDAQNYTYERLGNERASILHGLLATRSADEVNNEKY